MTRNCRPKVFSFFAVILIVMIAVAAICAVIFTGKYNNKNNQNIEENVPKTSSKPIIWSSTSTNGDFSTNLLTQSSSKVTSTSTVANLLTTTENPFVTLLRQDWKALPMKGDRKLGQPVERVIVMDTASNECENRVSCINFVQKRQNDSYLGYNLMEKLRDIPENFLVASDGSVFEGRGFLHEGQHTIDYALTFYNAKAIGVAFIGTFQEKSLTNLQIEAFERFIENSISDGKIKEDFKLYYQEQLIWIKDFSNDNFFKTIKTWNNWKESE